MIFCLTLPSDDETKPSFQATVSPASFGTFLGAICGFWAVGLLVAIEMRVVAGRELRSGGFFGGCGRALLSPNPIPYLRREGDALQQAMYPNYSFFLWFVMSFAGTCNLVFLQLSLQQ